jgi:hypothetical protein
MSVRIPGLVCQGCGSDGAEISYVCYGALTTRTVANFGKHRQRHLYQHRDRTR